MDPTQLLSIYSKLSRVPGGRRIFSRAVGTFAPYTGTIPFVVEQLSAGKARVRMRDTRAVRNHLRCVHAIALMNLGEVATGLATYASLPRGSRGIIVGLGMQYTKKARGPILASCDVQLPTTPGKHDFEVIAVLQNAAGDEVARATATWRVDIPTA